MTPIPKTWTRKAHRILSDDRVETLEQLRQLSEHDILKFKSLGRKTLDVIKNGMAAEGLALASTREGASSWVYFVQSGPFIKIGWTRNVPTRLAALSSGSPHEMVLIGVVPCVETRGSAKEKELHRMFGHLHHRCEWFHFSQEIIDYIGALPEAP